jgi:preprotein translocase subunit YajC
MGRKTKKFLEIILLVALIAAAIYYFSAQDKTKMQEQVYSDRLTEPPAENAISFISGRVVSVDGQNILFTTDSGEEITAQVSNNTRLVIQVETEEGGLTTEEGSLSDFVESSFIIVQPAPLPDVKEYSPDKIQKIN